MANEARKTLASGSYGETIPITIDSSDDADSLYEESEDLTTFDDSDLDDVDIDFTQIKRKDLARRRNSVNHSPTEESAQQPSNSYRIKLLALRHLSKLDYDSDIDVQITSFSDDEAWAEILVSKEETNPEDGSKITQIPDNSQLFSIRNARVGDTRDRERTRSRGNLLQCKVCYKQLSSRERLRTHMRSHVLEQRVSCPICHLQVRNKKNLENHMGTHAEEKQFECEFCGTKFASKPSWISHQVIHAEQKPFQCVVCEWPFQSNANLIRHMRTHTGEKPYECEVCERRFARIDNLRNHMKVHETKSPHKCLTCRTFHRSKVDLEFHRNAKH